MKRKKKEILKDLYEFLLNTHLNKEKSYEILVQDSNGFRIENYNREQYLEFVLSVAVERLGENFSKIVEGE